MGIAVMDIGSNSVRLLLWTEEGQTQRLNTTRLGEGAAKGFLTESSMARTVEAIAEFAREAKELGLPTYAFATSAVRDAQNASALLDGIRRSCGLEVDVLSGADEALCAYLGALYGKDGAVIDIGGNSTELALGAGGRLQRSVSMQVGAVRLQTLFADDREKATAYIRECLAGSGFGGMRLDGLAGIGGTITSLAACKLGLDRFDADLVDGCPLELPFMRETVDRLWRLDVEGRAALPGISQTRAQIIHQGALVLLETMEALGCERVYASVHDNLEGYVFLRGLEVPA